MYTKFLPILLCNFLSLIWVLEVNGQCTVSCPQDIVVTNAAGKCGANVTYSINAGNCTVTSTPASGSFFPVGITTVQVTSQASNGSTSTCSFKVTVLDKEAPKILNVSVTPQSLWPPNHKMRDVTVNYNTTDNCGGPITCKLSVSSNEPVNDIGDGNTAPDWIVSNDHRVQLRAERAGPLNGRVYTITIGCKDLSNNSASTTTQVTVPHDQGNKKHSDLTIKVGPNPSKSRFNVIVESNDKSSKINLTITDLQGRVFEAKKDVSAGQSVVVGASLMPGTYTVKAQQGSTVSETKILKQ